MRVQQVDQYSGPHDMVILIRLRHDADAAGPMTGPQHCGPTPPVGHEVPTGDPIQAEAVGFVAAARRRPIRDRFRDRLVDAAVARGADRAAAEGVVDELASDRPLLDWLMGGGFEKLLEMVMKLIGLLG